MGAHNTLQLSPLLSVISSRGTLGGQHVTTEQHGTEDLAGTDSVGMLASGSALTGWVQTLQDVFIVLAVTVTDACQLCGWCFFAHHRMEGLRG